MADYAEKYESKIYEESGEELSNSKDLEGIEILQERDFVFNEADEDYELIDYTDFEMIEDRSKISTINIETDSDKINKDSFLAFAKKSKVYRNKSFIFTTTRGDIVPVKKIGDKYYIADEKTGEKVEIGKGDFAQIKDSGKIKDINERLERSQRVNTIVSFAFAQLGKPYVWGASGPNSYDCSGLVSAAYKKIGLNLKRTSYHMCYDGMKVQGKDLKPGDLVFFNITKSSGHVGMYIGGGQYIHAPKAGDVVKISPMSYQKNIFGAKRFI